ncbi:MAG: hypothetical protein WBD56_04675 [Anaerolineales bacterium]
MKKMTFILVSLILILVLAACGETVNETGVTTEGVDTSASDTAAITTEDAESSISNAQAGASEDAASGTSDIEASLNSDYENALSVPMQLVMGTFMLEDTELTVDSDQAAQLLPLWKAARSLGSSDTAAAEEVGAVYNQIQETMTPEQIAAIAAMQIGREDMFGVVQELGLSFGGGGGDFTPEMQATAQAARASGQGFPGGFGGRPGGGGGPGGGAGGAGLSPEGRETAIAERGGTRGAGPGVNPAYLEAVILLLEGKTG